MSMYYKKALWSKYCHFKSCLYLIISRYVTLWASFLTCWVSWVGLLISCHPIIIIVHACLEWCWLKSCSASKPSLLTNYTIHLGHLSTHLSRVYTGHACWHGINSGQTFQYNSILCSLRALTFDLQYHSTYYKYVWCHNHRIMWNMQDCPLVQCEATSNFLIWHNNSLNLYTCHY